MFGRMCKKLSSNHKSYKQKNIHISKEYTSHVTECATLTIILC